MYQPHPDERIEDALQRFLQVVRGIQLLHDAKHKPNVVASTYHRTHDPRDGRTFWLLKVPSKSKHLPGAMQQYAFVVRTQFTDLITPQPRKGAWAVGTILGVRAGSPNLERGLGSLFGDEAFSGQQEPPDIGFLLKPQAPYFMDFCGPDKVGQRYQRENGARRRAHIRHIKAQQAPKTPPLAPNALDDAFADLLAQPRTPGAPSTYQPSTYVPRLPPPEGRKSEQNDRWDKMLLRKKLQKDLADSNMAPGWLDDFLSDVNDDPETDAKLAKADAEAKAADQLDHTFFDDL
ncbi:hypothetical protein N9917_00445 [Deltaproteobacteria bacterium]|nr:hypothetical protein [Deltaproteobacteria bacterium]